MRSTAKNNFFSKTENLSLIRKFIKDFLINNSVSKDDQEKIILAIDEACTNKIKHAYNHEKDKLISIQVELKENIFTAKISDWGKPFEPSKILVPNLEENYRNRKKGGYGIYLMKQLMDKIEYKSLQNGENLIILTKKVRFDNE